MFARPTCLAQGPQPADYNITLVTDSTPDFTDIASYLRSVTTQYSTPQEKAIGVWRWSQRLRKQTAWPEEDGHEILDPIFFFTSYGYTQCGIISGIDNSLWLNLGWKAHYVQLGDHTVSECSWDDGKNWHMFDNSMSIYCFNDKGEVASTREIEKHAEFYLENFAPGTGTNPVKGLKDQQGWRSGSDRPAEFQRTLANGMDSFLPPNEVFDDHLAIRWGRSYVLNLRPNETYTRYFKNLDAAKSDPRYYRPLRGKDVEVSTGDKNIRGNGVWNYTPDLHSEFTRAHVYSESGVQWTKDGIAGAGQVTFKVSAANVVTSAKLKYTGTGNILISSSRDAGIQWEPITVENGEAELIEQVAGGTEFLIKAELREANAALSAINIETRTQLNRAALPKLTRGPNRVQVRLGPQVETIVLAPSVAKGNHSKTVYEEKNLDVHPKPYFNVATLRAGVKNEPCYATWKIETPTPIVDANYGGNITVRGSTDRVTLLHSWNGKDFTQDFQKANGAQPYDFVTRAQVKETPPANAKEAYFRYQFESPSSAADWKSPGIQTALMTVHHQPRTAGFTPIEVTYCWVEHRESGDAERQHTEIITSPSQEYTIDVDGFRDPTMKWVRMNLQGSGPQGKVASGYSDGKGAAAAQKAPWFRYTWGKNLALGKSYKLEGKQDDRNPDAGHDLTDGIIAPPDTYVSVKYMPTNVMFAKDVSPVATLDLGSAQTTAAVAVHAGQEGGFHLTYPDTITVETSSDGTTFTRAGSAAFNQVFEPAADFVPWELDDAAQFDNLPAGGRLAYAYRIIFDQPITARYVRVTCACRKGWAVLLSEIEVFDKVTIDKNVPPLVYLPAFLSEIIALRLFQ